MAKQVKKAIDKDALFKKIMPTRSAQEEEPSAPVIAAPAAPTAPVRPPAASAARAARPLSDDPADFVTAPSGDYLPDFSDGDFMGDLMDMPLPFADLDDALPVLRPKHKPPKSVKPPAKRSGKRTAPKAPETIAPNVTNAPGPTEAPAAPPAEAAAPVPPADLPEQAEFAPSPDVPVQAEPAPSPDVPVQEAPVSPTAAQPAAAPAPPSAPQQQPAGPAFPPYAPAYPSQGSFPESGPPPYPQYAYPPPMPAYAQGAYPPPYSAPPPAYGQPSPVQPPEPAEAKEDPEDEDFVVPILNLTERIALDHLDDAIKRLRCCDCEQCRRDVTAIALNHLQPRYMLAQDLMESDLFDRRLVSETVSALTKAVFKVKTHPRH